MRHLQADAVEGMGEQLARGRAAPRHHPVRREKVGSLDPAACCQRVAAARHDRQGFRKQGFGAQFAIWRNRAQGAEDQVEVAAEQGRLQRFVGAFDGAEAQPRMPGQHARHGGGQEHGARERQGAHGDGPFHGAVDGRHLGRDHPQFG